MHREQHPLPVAMRADELTEQDLEALHAQTLKMQTEQKETPPDLASCEVIVERNGDELWVPEATAPKRRRRYTFQELMAGVTPENIHPEVDMGPPVGNESL